MMLDFETTHADYPNMRDDLEVLSPDKKDLSFPKFIENKEEEEKREEARRARHRKLVRDIQRKQKLEEEREVECKRVRIWERDKRLRLERVWSRKYHDKNWKKLRKRDDKYFKQMEENRIKIYESTPLFKYTDLVCKSMITDDTVVKHIRDNYREKRGYDQLKVTFTIDEHYYTASMKYNIHEKYYTDKLELCVEDTTHGNFKIFSRKITRNEIEKVMKFYKKKDRFLKRKRMAMMYKEFNKED